MTAAATQYLRESLGLDAVEAPSTEDMTARCAWCTWSRTAPEAEALAAQQAHRDTAHPGTAAANRAATGRRLAAEKAIRAARPARRAAARDVPRQPRQPAPLHGGSVNNAEKCRRDNGGKLANACDLCRPVLEARNARKRVDAVEYRRRRREGAVT